jgi:hypothetical protein
MKMAKPSVSTTFNAIDKTSGVVKKMGDNISIFGRNSAKSVGGIGSAFSALKGVALTAFAALTTGAVAKMVTDFARAGDEIAKTARQVGLSVEAFQELTFAADRQGVSAETFNTSLEKLNQNLGQLQVGQGTLLTTMRQVNPVLAQQLRTVDSTEEAFYMVIDAINAEESASRKAAIATAAFGRSGQDIIRMAEAGTDGIEALREEARRYGSVMSTEAANSAEVFVDSLTNLKSTMQGLKNQALTPLMNAIQPLIQRFADFFAANKDIIGLKIQDAFQKIKDIAQVIVDLWNSGLIPAVLAGVATFKAITGAIAIYKTVMALATGIQLAFNTAMTANPIGLIIVGIAALVALIVLLAKNWDKVKNALATGAQFIGDLMQAIFYTVADVALSTFGEIAKKVLSIAANIGKALGINVEGLERTVSELERDQAVSRERGLIGGSSLLARDGSDNRTQVDVNLNNVPQGSQVRQTGRAPGVTVNTGFGEAVLQ